MNQNDINQASDPKIETQADRFRVTFADGTTYQFKGESAIELILSSFFLKFLTICILIFAVLQQRSDVGPLNAWENIAVWLLIAAAAALWLIVAVGIVIWLRRCRLIGSLYTPFISVPIVVFTEPTLQFTLRILLDQPPIYDYVRLEYLVQPMVAIFLMDMLFGNFVAAVHPMFVKDDRHKTAFDKKSGQKSMSQSYEQNQSVSRHDSELSAKPDVKVDDTAEATSESSPKTLNTIAARDFNGEKVIIHEIRLMQIEDHYLRIDTDNRQILTRYKMSAAVGAMAPDVGIQINRSVWVARKAIDSVIRTPTYGAEVLLKNGNSFSVSRSRRSGVLEACNRWGIEVQRRD